MPDRLALYLQEDYSLAESIEFVRYAEARGFETVWQAETRFVRDSVVAMAAYAAVTRRIQVGSAVTNIWTRNVATLAAEYLTLDDLAQDRIVCGLGSWYDPLAAQVGVNRQKQLLAMREVLTTLRRMLAMERVTHHGAFVSVEDIVLDVQSGRKTPRRVPLYIGATGPKMLALAGEIADGVLLNYLVSPGYNQMALAQLEIGARKGGRTVHDVDRPQLIVCSIHADRNLALDRARRFITPYLATQPQMMQASGVDPYLLDEIRQILPMPARPEQIDQAMRLIPNDVVQRITASGTAQEVRAKVRDYASAGATQAILYPLGNDVRHLIDTFANGYSQA